MKGEPVQPGRCDQEVFNNGEEICYLAGPQIKAEIPWWPPKVGDILRKEEYFSDAERSRAERAIIVKRVAAKVHVLAVFEHDDETWIVGAIWFPTKQRWSRQVFGIIEASYQLWRDGETPEKHRGIPEDQ